MGKRSDFTRRKNDLYETFDPRAVAALKPHLDLAAHFAEPCAGRGLLVDQLTAIGITCVWAADVEPGRDDIHENDATTCGAGDIDLFITNPPWTRSLLHDIIVNLSDKKPTWLLFDADWMHTKQAAPYMNRLRAVVSVGRLKWIPGTKMDGKDNCCWYLFDKPSSALAVFVGRSA